MVKRGSVCSHLSRPQIDLGLKERVPYCSLARPFGLSPSALSRHVKHLACQPPEFGGPFLMASFRNHPGPLTKSAVYQAACRLNLSATRRYQCGTTCGQKALVETTARSIVSTSPKKRPNFNLNGVLTRTLRPSFSSSFPSTFSPKNRDRPPGGRDENRVIPAGRKLGG
jgi:hypothetical protein